MRLACVLLAAGLVLGGAGHEAGAQGTEAPNAQSVRADLDTALANIEHARCGTSFCTAATPDEIAEPPLSLTDATAVLQRGAVSGFARACGMDWINTSFQPMMATWRAQKKSERQLALIGILHGMGLGRAQAAIGTRPCTDAVRAAITKSLATFP